MDRRQFLTIGAVAGLSVAAVACARETGASSTPSPSSPPPEPGAGRVTVIAEGLNVPWAIGFLRDGSALVTQRDDATIARVTPDGSVVTVGDVPDVAPRGEGGLQGIAIAPGDETTVFVYYTSDEDNRLVRLDFDGRRTSSPRPLLTGLEAAYNHHGGAITVGPDGYLYVAVGDAAQRDVAQDLRELNGKILRLGRDGRPPSDNPFGNEIWSYGHRNVEGLAFDAAGRLWATEFGQDVQDELNVIRRGGNYGWPQVEGRETRNGDDTRFIAPAVTWTTDEASPAGLAFVGSTAYVAALRGRRLWRVPLDGDGAAGVPVAMLAESHGRLRSVAAAPDGSLWIGTSNTDGRGRPDAGDDRILQVTV
ncbi:PQQ-dependent sugar dehydrogenase [Gordonia sp. SID5947]|uniref:PQQ-dependent sugar dehydrogenase n=1 Tax=Gordonia sp. SID5947 TaxID=2690315 RepID=UPI00136E6B3B|nr:PQQ-dependent sugar dehydrogenase [Gordonia sp. SID5947]MYR08798.1 PQQ-dependent sugar dehydrogenase [Gordonia sp. SID5947]